MAVLADPCGAVLCVWQPRAHVGAGRVNDVGCLTWNELQSRDPESAAFYAGLFGWKTEPIKDDGKLVYVGIKNAGSENGGIMPMTEQHGDAPLHWLPYFTVPSCDGAIAKVRELGATRWSDQLTYLGAGSRSYVTPRARRSRSSRARLTIDDR